MSASFAAMRLEMSWQEVENSTRSDTVGEDNLEVEIGKVAMDVTEKVAESLAPSLVRSLFDWGASRRASKREAATLSSAKEELKHDLSRSPKHRGGWERRVNRDRRASPLIQRLRKGFWFEFHRRTESSKFDSIAYTMRSYDDLCTALSQEGKHYQFTNRAGGSVELSTVVEVSVDLAWSTWRNVPLESNKAIYLIEKIVDNVTSRFNFVRLDRRSAQRRTEDTKTG